MTRCHLIWSTIILFSLGTSLQAQEPSPILLWPSGAPGSESQTTPETVRLTDQGDHIVSNVHHPSILPYLPNAERSTGTAVIVIPGGGHRELWMDHEGYRVGQWLCEHGIAAFVLKYRLAKAEGSTYTVDRDELADVQRAIRLVRSRAGEWHVSPDRIGVIGFSAGGELAALAGTRFDSGAAGAKDPIDRQSSRPAFMGLIYPAPRSSLVFGADTPPAFLLAGDKDVVGISDSLPTLYAAIRRAGGSAEMHILAGVGHGFGIRDNNPPAVAVWTTLFYHWLDARGMLRVAGSLGRRVGGSTDRPVLTTSSVVATLSPQMTAGFANSTFIPVYPMDERGKAAQEALGLAAPPTLGAPISLTPNAPYGSGGAHLSFWKPSFVLGTSSGGEAGINFWGIHTEGHINVGWVSTASSYLLDCRLLSAGKITWKLFSGAGETPRGHGAVALSHNHFLLLVPASKPDESLSVEIWPTPVTEPMGLLGCELSAVAGR